MSYEKRAVFPTARPLVAHSEGLENNLLVDLGFRHQPSDIRHRSQDFWLNLLHDNGYLDDKQFKSLEIDITRILKILTSIVKTLRTKLGLEKHEP